MNFQPTDYLANLNLEFDNVSPEENTNDLDLFSQSEFFDLDVFSSDFSAPLKEQQRSTRRPSVKLEYMEQNLLLPIKESVTESPFVLEMETPEVQQPDLSEIKRKRNTAASARFRIKKKLKEKQMEQQTRDLQEKLSVLEKKVRSLEMENKCLKQLILEKNEERNCDLLESIKKRSLGESGFTFTN